MKRNKLKLATQTVRNLSLQTLASVGGGSLGACATFDVQSDRYDVIAPAPKITKL